jgi:hypothetical protein
LQKPIGWQPPQHPSLAAILAYFLTAINMLYRFRDGESDVWVIDGLEPGYDAAEKSWPAESQHIPRSAPRILDQDAFEKALMSYLR